MKIKPLGDQAMVLHFGDSLSEEMHEKVMSAREAIIQKEIPGIIDHIPAYTSLTLVYDPDRTSFKELSATVGKLKFGRKERSGSRVLIPVCYDKSMAPDHDLFCDVSGLGWDEVVDLHINPSYLVYMIGFLPGFPYMGEVHSKIRLLRKETPGIRVEEGAVGVAGEQTGIYPMASPGGWNLIGRCPVRLFDPARENTFTIEAGDQVQFFPITRQEFDTIAQDRNFTIKREHVDQ